MNKFVGWDKPQRQLDDFFQTDENAMLMVSGPVGVGKSTMPRHFAKKHGYRLLELASTATLDFMQRKQPRKCLLCIDDYDSATAYFKGFDTALKKQLKKGQPKMKVFLSGSDLYQIQRWFRDIEVVHVKLYPPFLSAIRSLLRTKSWKVAKAAQGDVRKALQLDRLQWGHQKNDDLSDFDIAKIILGDRANPDFRHSYTYGAVEWAFHNYLDDVEDIEDVVDFSERFSSVGACREAMLSLKKPTPLLVPKRQLSWKHRDKLRRYNRKQSLRKIGEKFGVFGMPAEELHHYLRCVRSLRYLPLDMEKRKQMSEQHGLTIEDKRFIFATRK